MFLSPLRAENPPCGAGPLTPVGFTWHTVVITVQCQLVPGPTRSQTRASVRWPCPQLECCLHSPVSSPGPFTNSWCQLTEAPQLLSECQFGSCCSKCCRRMPAPACSSPPGSSTTWLQAYSQNISCVAWNPKEQGLLASCNEEEKAFGTSSSCKASECPTLEPWFPGKHAEALPVLTRPGEASLPFIRRG